MHRLVKWTAVLTVVSLAVFGAPAAMASQEPWHRVDSPSPGASAQVGEPVLITGYSYVGEGTAAERTELSFDDGVTWDDADIYPNGTWHYLYTPTQSGDVAFRMRGWYNGELGDVSEPHTFHVGTPGSLAQLNCTLCTFFESEYPQYDFDPVPIELGVRFAVDRPGLLNGVRFRTGTYRGPVTVRVWGPGGTLLHEHIKPSGVGSSFEGINPPIPVQPGNDYVVSYYTPEGGYYSSEYFYTGTLFHAPFIVRADAGVYHYGEGGGFPTDTWHQSNYTVYPYFVS